MILADVQVIAEKALLVEPLFGLALIVCRFWAEATASATFAPAASQ